MFKCSSERYTHGQKKKCSTTNTVFGSKNKSTREKMLPGVETLPPKLSQIKYLKL